MKKWSLVFSLWSLVFLLFLINPCWSQTQIGTKQIKDGAVTQAKIAADSVSGDTQIIDDSIPTEAIKDKAITTDKIDDGAVTQEKIAEDAVSGDTQIIDDSIPTEAIKDGAITQAKIAADSISGDTQIIDNTILEQKLKAGDAPNTTQILFWNDSIMDWLYISELSEYITPDSSTDYLLIYDATAGLHKKILPQYLETAGGGGGGGAPIDATYITQTANAGLPAEQALESLATGILKNTTTTGVLSIAIEGTDYLAPSRIDDTKGNGDTTYVWSADKVFDQLALKIPLIILLKDFWTDASTSGTDETDLYSYTVPVNTLALNGEKIEAEFEGICFFQIGQYIKVYFAGTELADFRISCEDYSFWTVEVTIIRTGTSTARCSINIMNTTGGMDFGISEIVFIDLTSKDWTATNILKITGQTTEAAKYVMAKLGTVKWVGAGIDN